MSQKSFTAFDDRRIAIFEPSPDLMTNPSLACLLEALTCGGARVDVMMPDTGDLLSIGGKVARYRVPLGLALWRGDIRRSIAGWLERFGLQRLRLEQKFAAGAYGLILGIDSGGLIRAFRYAKRFRVPLVYLCFEIFFRDELSSDVEVVEKERETVASKHAQLVIIQDPWRAELLAAENGLSLEKFEYLPVSPGGFRRAGTSDYLRRRFNLSDKQSIVLHSGSFAEWTFAEELIESAITWPQDFVLVIHTRDKSSLTDKFTRAFQKVKCANVFLSTEQLPIDEYEQIVASADIGLVLYKPMPPSRFLQKNIQNIGLSSGKFSFYMKYGIPVISIAQKSYDELLKDYSFGENITFFDEMPEALRRIRSNYAHHRAEAKRLFEEKLDFDIHWPKVAARLLKIMK